jgi:hypothetical protein
MKVKYFQTDAGYIAVTDQCPKDFKHILFIGKQGTDPLKVEEGVFTPDQVLKLPEIAKADMPAVWMLAFGYEKPVAPKKPPEPEYDEFPLFDPETNDLLDYIPVRRQRRQVLHFTPNRKPYDLGLIIGICIGLICIALGLL